MAQVQQNITETIGVPYEVIAIDNSEKRYGICEAYNIGASQSTYKYLCFMHEDIKCHTIDWGKIVLNLLSDLTIGLIGIAGSKLQPNSPSAWHVSMSYTRIHILQHRLINTTEEIREIQLDHHNPENESLSEVVTIDGVWFCCRKEVWIKTKFDAITFQGFHFYDLDFSVQVFLLGYRICVTYDILIEHFSEGSKNISWIEAAWLFYKKWKDHLPLATIKLTPYITKETKFHGHKMLLWHMIENNYNGNIMQPNVEAYLRSHPAYKPPKRKGWKKVMKKLYSLRLILGKLSARNND